jgi:hypothetical protein
MAVKSYAFVRQTALLAFDLFHPSDFLGTLPRLGDHLKSRDTRCPAMSDQGLRPVGGVMGLTKEHFGNSIAGGKAKGDFIELLFQFGVHIWKTNQYGLAKRTLRRLLNDAVYSLRRRPEGHYVAIVMATRNHTGTRDARVKWQSNMIELTGGTAKLPAPIWSFNPHNWQQLEPVGIVQHLIVVYNQPGECPVNLPAGSLNLAEAAALLQKL